MLVLRVTDQKQSIRSVDGIILSVCKIVVKTNLFWREFQKCRRLGKPDNIELYIGKSHSKERLPIPKKLEEAVLYFIETYQTPKPHTFDCYAFANKVANVEEHCVSYLRDYWTYRRLKSKPSVGDVIFLLDIKQHRFRHAAVYIGENLYISVYGAGGDLEISTLEDMQRDYDAPDVVISNPKQKEEAESVESLPREGGRHS